MDGIQVVAEPSPAYHGLQFHETFGTYGYLMKLRAETLRDLGAAMSPFNAFLFLQGLETLSLRMERHVENAKAVAEYLAKQELASNVMYPGLESSRYRALVDKYLPHGAGAVFLVRVPRWPRRGPGLHPRRHLVVASRERRRFQEPHHPSREHDASAAQRR
jgi:O-acetylhomoserine/O-acetylserine sulfhydrylase-like pyridoxal-dependent enzyme